MDSLTAPLLPRVNDNTCRGDSSLPNENDVDVDIENDADADADGLSTNIHRILMFTWCVFTGRSIWGQSVLAVFIFLLRPGSPESVGYVTAVMGISQVLASFPADCLANYCRRETMLKLASIIGLLAVAATSLAVLRRDYLLLIGAMSLWGIMWGISDNSLASLFCDSIPKAKRVLYFKRGSSLMKLGNFSGPLIALVIFYYLGDTWSIRDCSIVMAAGLALCVPAILILCCLRDDRDIDEAGSDLPIVISFHDPMEEEKCEPLVSDTQLTCHTLDIERQDESFLSDSQAELEDNSARVCCYKGHLAKPILITLADMLSGIASGMSIRYFPIFLMDQLQLSPVKVHMLCIATVLGQSTLTKAARGLAKRCGLCRVSALFQWIFVSLLVSMVVCYVQGLPVWLVCLLYVAHSSLMNSTGSLSKEVLLDTVPKEDLIKWNSVETLQMLLWSGSAALGGVLVDYWGIVFTFYVTAGLQLVASLPLVCLFSRDNAAGVGPTERGSNGFLDSDDANDLSSIPMVNSEGDEGDTVYQSTRDRIESSQSEFFDCLSCHSRSLGNADGSERRLVQYLNEQCVYEDGTPAFVQQGDCENDLPSHYLAACGGRRKNAMDMWKASRKWRQENDVWKIHQKPNRWFPKIKEAYPHFVHGYTKDGYPVIYERPGRMLLKSLFREGCEISNMTTWYIFFMEYLSNCICTRPEIRSRRGLDTTHSLLNSSSWGFVVVMDMEGAGMSTVSGDVLSYLKQAGAINSAHYPLSMKRAFMVKAGPVVARLWSGVKFILPKSAHVDIMNKYHSALREHIVSLPAVPAFSNQFHWT
jgi:hypothetical protein